MKEKESTELDGTSNGNLDCDGWGSEDVGPLGGFGKTNAPRRDLDRSEGDGPVPRQFPFYCIEDP
ncbi:hypothetical protein [Nannocystis pusilla]|uniref:hypothetical protein n=1 Tax=Nannocystis pusilla TaxID=889268 RepID=UPI003DA3B273